MPRVVKTVTTKWGTYTEPQILRDKASAPADPIDDAILDLKSIATERRVAAIRTILEHLKLGSASQKGKRHAIKLIEAFYTTEYPDVRLGLLVVFTVNVNGMRRYAEAQCWTIVQEFRDSPDDLLSKNARHFGSQLGRSMHRAEAQSRGALLRSLSTNRKRRG